MMNITEWRTNYTFTWYKGIIGNTDLTILPNCWTGAMGELPYCLMIFLKNSTIERDFWESI